MDEAEVDDEVEISIKEQEDEGQKDNADEMSLNMCLSIQYFEEGKYEEAIVSGKKCLQMATENGNRYAKDVVNACLIIGESELEMKEYTTLLKISMTKCGDGENEVKDNLSYERMLRSLGYYDKTFKYDWWSNNIGNKPCEAEKKNDLGEYDDVITFCMRALDIAKEIGYKHAEIKSCSIMAKAYRALRSYDEAIEYAWRWIEIAKETADKHSEMKACLFLTETYKASGDCQNTIQCASMLRVLAKETDEKEKEMEACFVIMENYESLQQHKEAVQYAKMYLQVAKETEDKRGEKSSTSMPCNKDGHYEEAALKEKKVFQMSTDNGSKYAEMKASFIIGESELKLKLEEYVRSKDIEMKNSFKAVTMEESLSYAEALFILGYYDKTFKYDWWSNNIGNKPCEAERKNDLGEYEDVITFCMRALDIAKENEYKHTEVKSCSIMAKAYRALRSYDEAIEYAWRWIEIAKETADKHSEMKACLFLTEIYKASGDCQNTIQCASMLRVLAKETDEKEKEMEACFVIMENYESLQQHKEAVQYAKMYLEVAKETGYKHDELDACYFIINIDFEARNYAEAVEYGKMYADVAKEIGDKRSEIHACILIEWAIRSLESYDDVIQFAKERMTREQKTDDEGNKKIGCFLLGLVDINLEKYDKAVSSFRKAIDYAKEEGDEYGEMTVCHWLGEAHIRLSQLDDAISCFERSLRIAKKIGDQKLKEMKYSLRLSNYYAMLNRSDEGESYATIALEIAKELDDKQGQMEANMILGIVYRKSGREDEADACVNEFASISKETGDALSELNACWMAAPYSSPGEAKKLNEKAQEILNRFFSMPDPTVKVNLSQSSEAIIPIICPILDSFMPLTKAFPNELVRKEIMNCVIQYMGIETMLLFPLPLQPLKHYLEKMIDAPRIPLKAKEKAALKKLVQSLTEKEQSGINISTFEDMLVYITEILDAFLNLLNDLHIAIAHSVLALLHSGKGVSYYLLEDIPRSKRSLEEAIRYFESQFDNLHDVVTSKISIVDKYTDTYKLLEKILIEEHNNKEALLVAERCRAKALKDILVLEYGLTKEVIQEGHIELDNIWPILKAHKSSILFYTLSFNELHKFVLKDGHGLHCSVEPLPLLEWTLKKLIKEIYQELNLSCDFRCQSASWTSSLPQIFKSDSKFKEDTTEILKLLFESNEALEEGMIPEKIYDKEEIWSMLTSFFEETGNSRAKETTASPSFINGAQRTSLESLSQMLLGDTSLEQDEVIIIPDGLLSIVPFAALTNPATGRYLSEDKKIRFAPSLATLKLISESREDTDFHLLKGGIFIGNPDVSRVLCDGEPPPPLQNAEIEANVIAEKFNARPLIGAHATKRIVLEKLHEGASVVHIAAHGNLDKATIFLAPDPNIEGVPKEEDYMLTMAEVQQARVRAQLVVLSCCHSGRGEIRAEGVVGMCRAFLASGARAVVATLWAIDDEATLEFMLAFYDRLQMGESASTSLQMAMNEIRDIHENPMFWAPFFLMGDDVKIRF